jgi:hypothetical protein
MDAFAEELMGREHHLCGHIPHCEINITNGLIRVDLDPIGCNPGYTRNEREGMDGACNTANTPLNILNQMGQILSYISPLIVPIYMTTDSLRCVAVLNL